MKRGAITSIRIDQLIVVNDHVHAALIPDAERTAEIMLQRMRLNGVWLDFDPELKYTMSKAEKSKSLDGFRSRNSLNSSSATARSVVRDAPPTLRPLKADMLVMRGR